MATHQYTVSTGSITINPATTTYFPIKLTPPTIPDGETFVRYKITTTNAKIMLFNKKNKTIPSQETWSEDTVISYSTWYTDLGYLYYSYESKYRLYLSCSKFDSNVKGTVTITVETEDKPTYAINCQTIGSGTLTASPSEAYEGQTVTLTPTPGTGFAFDSYSSAVTITNNTFVMPGNAVTVIASFTAVSSIVSYYNGTQFVPCKIHYFDGTEFQECKVNYYDGTEWVLCMKS